MTLFSFSHFALLLLLITSSVPTSSLDITSLLSPYPDLSDFTSLLTSTAVSSDLLSRSSVTLLAVPNSYLRSSDLLHHSDPSSLADVIRYHVLLQYLSWSDLVRFPASGKLITTLYQTTGRATNNFGSLNITRNPDNGAVFATAPIPYSPSNAMFISSVKSLPYNLSIFTINSLLIPSGFNLVASESRPAPALNITKLLIDGHNFNVAASMLMASGVVNEFEQDERGAGITMFVPTDTAFSLLSPSQDLQSLPADKKGVVLRFHVLHSYYPLGSLESIVNPVQPTLATEDSGAGRYTLNISKINGSVAIDSGIVQALVTRTVFDQNPVAIFGVSRVLLPKEIFGSNSDPMVMTGPGVVIDDGQAPDVSPVPNSYEGSGGPSSFTGGDMKSTANTGTLNLQQRIVAYTCCIGTLICILFI